LNTFRRLRGSPGTALAVPLPEPHLAVIPEQFSHAGISLPQILSILRAYWKQSLAIALCITVLSAIGIKFLPKTYTATATLIVNSDTKDPLAGRDFPVEMLASYVATQTELMQSPVVLLPVVDRLKLTEDRSFTDGFSGDPDALREYVERNLTISLYIETGRGGQLLYVNASAKTAAKAADIANAVADVYIEQDRRRLDDPAGERAQRYAEELAELRAKATAAQDKVTAFRKQFGINDITAAPTDSEVQNLDNLQQRLLETQNLRRSLEAKESGQQSSADEALASRTVQDLKTLLSTQMSQLAQLSATYGPQHPKVRELNAQISLTRESLASETHTLSDNTATELARTKELEQKYSRAVTEQQAKVASLRQAQDEGGKLLLELESAKSVYKHALDGYDQIMFAAVANHTNVGFVSRAVAPIKASRPNKVKLMLLALVAGIGLGVAIPAVYELFFHRRLRCRDDMERGFGIAVLAQLESVPALSSAI
jgi:succinoglycan biosynthesis transport protein ExoP